MRTPHDARDDAPPPRGGECGALIRDANWARTPLGAPGSWPSSLRMLVSLMLNSRQAMFIVWGPERVMLYNDAYAEILVKKHPEAMGRPIDQVWSEIWEPDLKPIVEQAYRGESVHMDDIPLVMLRRGYPEETHFLLLLHPGARR
jgi:PAS domain-containing protein